MIIGFCGPIGAGKTTAAQHLMKKWGYARGKFAGCLKEMLRTYLRYRNVDDITIERMVEGDLKEVPSKHLMGHTPRYFMQHLGTKFGRETLGHEVWVDTEMAHIAGLDDVVFDDVRFPNEVDAIHRFGGKVVMIAREVPDREGEHESEQHTKLPFDYAIVNASTVSELQYTLEWLVFGYDSPLARRLGHGQVRTGAA